MNNLPAWREEPIAIPHDREAFDCGRLEQNQYLARSARQHHERGTNKTYVAVPQDAPQEGRVPVLGYYSLSAGEIAFRHIPAGTARRLPRHPVPIVRLTRLAVQKGWQGRGLGGQLLLSVGERALHVAADIGVFALAIEAKDQEVAGWYGRFGAEPLRDHPLILIWPLRKVQAALEARRAA